MTFSAVILCSVVLTQGSELQARVERNYDRLEEAKYQPDNVFLTMEQSWGWPGDTEGRAILALVLDAQRTGRTPKYLDEILRRFPSKLNDRGYFGPVWTDAVNEQQLSGMGWVLRGLCAHYRWKRDPKTLEWIRRIADNLFLPAAEDFAAYPIDPEQRKKNVGGASGHTACKVGRWELSSDVGCYMIGIDGLVDARMTLGDAKYDAVIDRAIARYLQIDQAAIKAQAHATLTGIRALLRYGTRYLPEAEERFRRYRLSCMTETYANANWFTRFETFTEPCAIIDSYMVALQLWSLTGKADYLELADRIYWNAICRAQRKNGGFGLETCPTAKNPVLKVHEEEAHWCCTMRGAEGLSTAADYVVRTNGNVLTLAQYHNATASVETPAGRVRFREETGYPFAGKVRVTVIEAPASEIVFRFFAPSYVKTAERVTDGFVERRGVFRPGETVEFTFELAEETLPTQSAANVGTGLLRCFRGPLLIDASDKGKTVWHRMADDIWERGSGARTVLFADPAGGAEDGFVPLFNGRDLTGWEGATNTYGVAADGCLTCLQRDGVGESATRNLWTVRDYTNFVIRFDVKLPPNANNGLGIRTPPNGWCSREGMELQLLDDWGDAYNGSNVLANVHYTGSIYGIVGPARRVNGESYLNRPGEWNTVEATADGPRIVFRLNGTTIVDADVSKFSTDGTVPSDGIKRPGLHNTFGRIHWCGHGHGIFWRNIRIKELP